MDHSKQILEDVLGVKPYEEFKIKLHRSLTYRITSDLKIEFYNSGENQWNISGNYTFVDFVKGNVEIIKKITLNEKDTLATKFLLSFGYEFVARDRDRDHFCVYGYNKIPKRGYIMWDEQNLCKRIELPEEAFTFITWQDEPLNLKELLDINNN